ncbi:c-type cytochrome [Endozoicomonas euniceicola]|uniref:Cytochrome c4 n=1 Tax=Endozoicomonas euniceicola TaxID=1234143 RepID=A0ABY6GZT8_9GAMM|nr:cytochrome c4 [Endozoicomonas euniceicola]UYM18312.1 cytochrome c4 [Endozoicomonas euniceicola]
MKKIILSFLVPLGVSLGVSGLAFAKGDAEAGKTKVATCTACHGATGISPAPLYPNLAGQGERYLIKQLKEIKSGVRSVPEMAPFVAKLSDQDMEDISAFYAKQTAAKGVADPDKVALGEKLFRFGDAKKAIPACSSCHSPTGQGNFLAGFPQISGQHPAYTAKQLKDYREGVRVNDGDSKTMRMISEKLSNKEVEALASYISGLQ